MTKKAALEHARRDCGEKPRLLIWDKQVIGEGKDTTEICILVIEFTTCNEKTNLDPYEWKKLYCFVNDKPKFNTYID